MDELFVGVVVIAAGSLIGNVVQWRQQRALLASRDALLAQREGWRNVAERSLLVAQMGRNVGRRAALAVAKVAACLF